MKRNLLTRLAAGAALAAMSVALTACSGAAESSVDPNDTSWEATVARAEEQGTLRIYSVAIPIQMQPLVDAFNEAYPNINVEVERGNTDILARVEAELGSGNEGADILLHAGQQWYIDHEENLLDINGPSAMDWPEDEYAAANAPVVSLVPAGFITWNTEIYPDGFETWQDVIDADPQGKLGMRSSIEIVTASHMQFLEDVNGPDYLPTLASLEPKFYDSSVPMTQAVASGEIGVTVLSTIPNIKTMQAEGAPIDYKIPDESWASVYIASALESASNPDAARVFIDFLMSKEGQTAFNADLGGSVLPDIEGAIDSSGFTIISPETMPPAKVEEWVAKFDEIFR
jgi:iron(III) transport system substrate-binding protein